MFATVLLSYQSMPICQATIFVGNDILCIRPAKSSMEPYRLLVYRFRKIGHDLKKSQEMAYQRVLGESVADVGKKKEIPFERECKSGTQV
jgi:hypothetical protein